jgi:hypothetical protein
LCNAPGSAGDQEHTHFDDGNRYDDIRFEENLASRDSSLTAGRC